MKTASRANPLFDGSQADLHMLNFFIILQAPIHDRGNAANLGTLNTLGIAIFVVGILLILLLVIHWYRMKDKLDRKERLQRHKTGRFGEIDTIKQLQYMDREELRAMILREREMREAEARERGKIPETSEPASQDKLEPVSADAYESTAVPVTKEEGPPVLIEKTESPDQSPRPYGAGGTPEAQLLAKLAMPSEKERKEEEGESGEPSKTKPPDGIERSILSNDPLDGPGRKSRKI